MSRRAAVYYHEDFALKGYTTLMHRVKPGFDSLKPLIRAGKLEVRTPAVNEEARQCLQATHSADLIARVKEAGYHEIALLSAAGVIQAARALATGELDFAFCFVGSGGHHAGKNYCWGFCYYNDVAMAVSSLGGLGVERIMIIDVDPHSGDGTRDLLALNRKVIHLNFFADEDYAYQDHQNQNYGILLDNANDQLFLSAIDQWLQREWDFELLMVILGHDGHCLDYGDFYLTTDCFRQFAARVRTMAAGKPVLFVLSGGSLPEVAAEVIPAVIEPFLI
jgi:acetoin utilization deacetylase AcuC-like enzyme